MWGTPMTWENKEKHMERPWKPMENRMYDMTTHGLNMFET